MFLWKFHHHHNHHHHLMRQLTIHNAVYDVHNLAGQQGYNTSSSAMQRDRAKLDTFSINVQRYSQNHKIASLGHPMGASSALYESFNAQKLCSRVLSRLERMPVLLVKQQINVFEPPFVGA